MDRDRSDDNSEDSNAGENLALEEEDLQFFSEDDGSGSDYDVQSGPEEVTSSHHELPAAPVNQVGIASSLTTTKMENWSGVLGCVPTRVAILYDWLLQVEN